MRYKKVPKCFGEWLDTCYVGYKPCISCNVRRECVEKFRNDLKAEKLIIK